MELKRIEVLLTALNKQVSDLTRQVGDVVIALEGNTKLGIEGMVKKVNRHDSWITKMNLRMAAWSGAGGVIAIIAEHIFFK